MNIGFLAHHGRVPVTDYPYLSVPETLNLDWDDPWYSAFPAQPLIYSTAPSAGHKNEPPLAPLCDSAQLVWPRQTDLRREVGSASAPPRLRRLVILDRQSLAWVVRIDRQHGASAILPAWKPAQKVEAFLSLAFLVEQIVADVEAVVLVAQRSWAQRGCTCSYR